jgi:hypothetical protein
MAKEKTAAGATRVSSCGNSSELKRHIQEKHKSP